ncbi:MAG: helix-turn-helix domain-containing protein, partial [Bacteroidota bacterium]
AEVLQTNATYLSQVINQQYECNFNDYINQLRVNEAVLILKNDLDKKKTIDMISDMAGFSSKTTFYAAFKKFTGITPSFFQKSV